MKNRHQKNRSFQKLTMHGVTLVELVIVIVIISIALVASLTGLSVISGRSSNALIQSKAIELSQLYMDEILSKNFDEQTPPGGVPAYFGGCRITDDGERRENYDDVDDFDGVDEAPENVAQELGDIYSNYVGFNVQVDVDCDNTVGAHNNSEQKRITITITDATTNQIRLTAYKGNY